MNRMNLPGFTAEDPLYQRGEHYQITNSAHSVTPNMSLLQPALPVYLDGRYVCNGEVTDHGFINCDSPGGGPSGPPELRCGPCINGRQRCGIPGLGFSWGPCIE
jgi:hypothetical protein